MDNTAKTRNVSKRGSKVKLERHLPQKMCETIHSETEICCNRFPSPKKFSRKIVL